MKDPRTAWRDLSDAHVPPPIEQLRAGAKARTVGQRRSDRAHAGLVAHADALGTGRPTVSPAKARRGAHKPGSPGSFGLPD